MILIENRSSTGRNIAVFVNSVISMLRLVNYLK